MTDTAPFSERPQDAGSAQLSIATNAPWRPATKTRTKSGPSRDELPKPARPLALLRRHFNCVKCSGRLLPLARVSLRYRSRIRGSFVSSASRAQSSPWRSYSFFSAFSLTVCGYYGASRNVSTWGASFNICSTTSFLTAPPTTCAISSTSPISRKAASIPKRSIAC